MIAIDTRTPAQPRSRGGWVWIVLSSLAIVAFSVSLYLTASLQSLAANDQGLASTYSDTPGYVQVAFYLHISFAGLALVIGPFQFAARLRARVPRLHRWLGRIYLVAVVIGASASLVILPYNSAGYVGFFGFGALGILWLVTAARAYRAIRAGRIREHQAWMIRNFAITYAAVTLRLWAASLTAFQILVMHGDPATATDVVYSAVPFLAWLPNLVVAELLIRRRDLPGLRWTESSL